MNKLLNTTSTWFDIMYTVNSSSRHVHSDIKMVVKSLANLNFKNLNKLNSTAVIKQSVRFFLSLLNQRRLDTLLRATRANCGAKPQLVN